MKTFEITLINGGEAKIKAETLSLSGGHLGFQVNGDEVAIIVPGFWTSVQEVPVVN